jgi:DNA-binding transcriptional MerR regulator
VRIGELSRRTGVAVPTIKYYLRDGLLPPGELTSRNQAQYGEDHVQRLRLVRALIEVGGLSVASVRTVLEAAADPDRNQHSVFGKAMQAIAHTAPVDPVLLPAADEEVAALVERMGWRVRPDGPAWGPLASVLATFRQLGYLSMLERIDGYARAAQLIADIDMEITEARGTVIERLEEVIVTNVVGDVALTALRRMAQEDGSVRRFESAAAVDPGLARSDGVADGDRDADSALGASS